VPLELRLVPVDLAGRGMGIVVAEQAEQRGADRPAVRSIGATGR
jgi:hypothetical protein